MSPRRDLPRPLGKLAALTAVFGATLVGVGLAGGPLCVIVLLEYPVALLLLPGIYGGFLTREGAHWAHRALGLAPPTSAWQWLDVPATAAALALLVLVARKGVLSPTAWGRLRLPLAAALAGAEAYLTVDVALS